MLNITEIYLSRLIFKENIQNYLTRGLGVTAGFSNLVELLALELRAASEINLIGKVAKYFINMSKNINPKPLELALFLGGGVG